MQTQRHECVLDGNRTHIYWTAFEGEFDGGGPTEIDAITMVARRRDLKRMGDAKPCDIVETLLYGMPTGNLYQITSYQDLDLILANKVRVHDALGNPMHLHGDTAVRWCGDSRCINIKTLAFAS